MTAPRRSAAFWVRVTLLGLTLVLVAGYGFRRERRRAMRTDWLRPLTVQVLLVSEQAVPEATEAAWRHGVPQLGEWMHEQFARYRPAQAAPIHFQLVGPVATRALPLLAPTSESLLDQLLFTRGLLRELQALDASGGVSDTHADARIYVLLEQGSGKGQQVEGLGDAGGNIGLVRADLEDTELGLALTAVAHELFHCLGATDKYDGAGRTSGLQGLAEPDASPLFPQRFAEVMVGERPLTSSSGVLPGSLEEVAVGPLTASEIRWTP